MKKYLYLTFGGISLLAIVLSVVFLFSKFSVIGVFSTLLVVLAFGITAYYCLNVFLASIIGQKIKGTIIKEHKWIEQNGAKYITEYAFITTKGTLIKGFVEKRYECGFVPIRAFRNFKFVDNAINLEEYYKLPSQKLDKKSVAKHQFVSMNKKIKKKRGWFIILLIVTFASIVISLSI